MTEVPVSVRLNAESIERIERIAQAMGKRSGGVVPKRGTVVRAAVERGMAALEAELGLTKKSKR